MMKFHTCLLLLFLAYSDTSSPFLLSRSLPQLNHTEGQSTSQKIYHSPKRIPHYMVQLYRELTTTEGLLKQRLPYNVNSIRGIYSKRISKTSRASMEIFYDIGYLHGHFSASRDEIHLYMKRSSVSQKDIFKPFVIKLHDIHTNKRIRVFKVPAFNHGWQVLSMRGWSRRWLKDPVSNKGLRLTVYRGRRRKVAKENPFVQFPEGNDPYLMLFGNDNDNSLLSRRFLSSYPMNSVAAYDKAHFGRQRRDTERRPHPHCEARQKSVKLKGRRIDEQYVIVKPESYKITSCTKTCIRVTKNPKSSSSRWIQTFQRFCCVPEQFRAVAFLVMEPSRETATFLTVPNVVAAGCMWSAS